MTGLMCINGQGMAKNISKAVQLLEAASAQGVATAQHNLGTADFHDCGLLSHARHWLLIAGAMYAKGKAVTQDDAKAVQWYAAAAAQGYAEAQFDLGTTHFSSSMRRVIDNVCH